MSKTPLKLVKPDKDSISRFEPYYVVTQEDFKQAIIEARMECYKYEKDDIRKHYEKEGEEYYKNKYT